MKVLVIGAGAREHALCRALSADPAVTALVLRSRQPGHRPDRRTRAGSTRSTRRRSPLWRWRRRPTWSSSGPRHRWWPGWPIRSGRRHPGVRAVEGGRAARGFQGLLQGADGRGRHPHRACPSSARTTSEYNHAFDEFRGAPYVVKDDALAAGKGVVVTEDRVAALRAHPACGRVVIEEYLDGPEVSLFGITDGTTVVPLRPGPGLQADRRRRHRAEHRRDGLLLRRCRGPRTTWSTRWSRR